MEDFFGTREKVSFLCNGDGELPNPNDYLEERKCSRFLHPETYFVLPDGTIHGKYTTRSEFGGYLLEKTYSLGVLNGPYLYRTFPLACEGNYRAGVPEGIFSVFRYGDSAPCTVTYKGGIAVSHEYKGEHCPLQCQWDHERVDGNHTLSWSFRESELFISLRTDKGVKKKKIKSVYERNFYFDKAPRSQALVLCDPSVLPTKRTLCLEKDGRYVFLP
nr:hypothetical protein MarFTME_114 [Marseillevirus futianmevirus]